MAYCQHNTQNVIQYVCKYMIGSKIDRYSVLDIMNIIMTVGTNHI